MKMELDDLPRKHRACAHIEESSRVTLARYYVIRTRHHQITMNSYKFKD